MERGRRGGGGERGDGDELIGEEGPVVLLRMRRRWGPLRHFSFLVGSSARRERERQRGDQERKASPRGIMIIR